MNLSSEYYSEPFSEYRSLHWRLHLLQIANSFKKNFSFKISFRTNFIKTVNKSFAQIYLKTEGFKAILQENSVVETQKFHLIYEKKLSSFLRLYSNLERINFFDNPRTHELADKILLNHYEIEAGLRQLAFPDPSENSEEYLKEASARLSAKTVNDLHAL